MSDLYKIFSKIVCWKIMFQVVPGKINKNKKIKPNKQTKPFKFSTWRKVVLPD